MTFSISFSEAIILAWFCVILIVWSWYYIPIIIKQRRCKHNGGVNETSACDAICKKCGKNLGFIGSWRKINSK